MTEKLEVELPGFMPGDIVCLRSGGEDMTVVFTKPGIAHCAWWNAVTGKPEHGAVAAVSLKLIEAA